MSSTMFWIRICPRKAIATIARIYNRQDLHSHRFSNNGMCCGNLLSNYAASSTVDVNKPLLSYQQNCADNSIERILSSVDLKTFSSFKATGILKALREQKFLKNSNLESIINNAKFKFLCSELEKTCHLLVPSMLVSALRSLLEIGIPPSQTLIDNIEMVILSKIDYFTMTDLVSCLHLHSKFLSTDRQKQVITVLITVIEEKLSEITTSAEVIMLVQMLHLFKPSVITKLESRIIKILPEIEMKDLIKVISILAESTKRNKTLLNAAGFNLRKKPNKPNMKGTVNVLYALNTLKYLNPSLLAYLTECRESEIREIEQPSVISGLLSACGQLKYRNSGVLEACSTWILEHMDLCTSREFVSYLLTIAALNYVPENISIIKSIMERLKLKDIGSKDVWLDIVWSLAVLDALDKELLITVLSPEFYTSLLEDSDNRSLSNRLKLMNLKTVLKAKCPEFVFSCDLFLDIPEIQRSKETENSKNLVFDMLNHFIPHQKYMETNINTDMGIFIDAEFIIGKDGKPLPISEYGLLSKPTMVTKKLPRGAKRVALLIWLYKDFTLNEKTLIGINSLAVRLLASQGYTVVEVPFETFVQNFTAIKKVMYLSELINTVVTKSRVNVKPK